MLRTAGPSHWLPIVWDLPTEMVYFAPLFWSNWHYSGLCSVLLPCSIECLLPVCWVRARMCWLQSGLFISSLVCVTVQRCDLKSVPVDWGPRSLHSLSARCLRTYGQRSQDSRRAPQRGPGVTSSGWEMKMIFFVGTCLFGVRVPIFQTLFICSLL